MYSELYILVKSIIIKYESKSYLHHKNINSRDIQPEKRFDMNLTTNPKMVGFTKCKLCWCH